MIQPIASILVPLDGSPFGEHALNTAIGVARSKAAAISLIHVEEQRVRNAWGVTIDPGLELELRAERRGALQLLTDQVIARTSLQVTLTVLQGPVVETLEKHIAFTRPDLVVMATHGETGVIRAILGSVADYIIRQSVAPVLLVRPTSIDRAETSESVFRHVLVALDGSRLAEDVIDRVLSLADPGTTRFTLLQVVALSSINAMPYPANAIPIEFAGAFDERRQELSPHLEALADGLRARGFETAVHIVAHWQPAVGIVEHADAVHADLIALSTRGHGGLRRFVLGSVADAVVHSAVTPVLVFHPIENAIESHSGSPAAAHHAALG
jgi:nucleotide-binding universal stress UspA family protein